MSMPYVSQPPQRPPSGPDGPPGPLLSGPILNGPPFGQRDPSLGTRFPGPSLPSGLEGPLGSHSQGPPERPQGHVPPDSGPMGGPLHVPTPKDYPQRDPPGPLLEGIPIQGPLGHPGPMPHGGPPNKRNIQRMLEENAALIKTISDYQNSGKHNETVQYQLTLHSNMMYLASLADST